jgi:restriction system protein
MEYSNSQQTKFCKFCGGRIPMDAVVCTLCGRQVEQLQHAPQYNPNVIINNANTNVNSAMYYGRRKDKWVAVLLCLFLGIFGAHKFYEGKIFMGLLYLFTGGLFGIGAIIDFIVLLCKPNPYFV